MLLEKLFTTTAFLFDEGDGGGTGGQDDPNPAGDQGADQEKKPFKSFATEEEYNNELKSNASRAKNDILKELGIKSVKEAKEALGAAKDLADINSKYVELQEEVTVSKAGIKDEYKTEAITLAKAAMKEGETLEDALKAVVTKLPIMVNTQPGTKKLGGEQGQDSDNDVTDEITKKYPWLKK